MANDTPPATAKDDFERALFSWKSLAEAHSRVSENYRMAKARAFLASTGKTEAARGADADVATAELRADRDQLAIAARAAEYAVQFLIAELKQ